MTYHRILTFLCCFFIIVIAISGCKKDSNPLDFDQTSGVIMPLKVGNLWKYKTTIYDTIGGIYVSADYSIEVTSDTVMQNERWFVLNHGEPYMQIPRYTNRYGGYYKTYGSSSDGYLEYKYPCVVGDTFHFSYIPVTVISINSIIQLPSGRYSCVQYRLDYGTSNGNHGEYLDIFYSENIGLIEEDYFIKNLSDRLYLFSRVSLTQMTLH